MCPSSTASFRSRRRSVVPPFLPCPRRNLDLIFSQQFERTVDKDNTVGFHNLVLQIEPVGWRGTMAGCKVVIHQHLDTTLTLTVATRRVGHYTAQGVLLMPKNNPASKAVEKTQLLRRLANLSNRTLHLLRTPDICTC